VTVTYPFQAMNRTYNIHIPASYNVNNAAPLIMAFHGRTETASTIEQYSGFSSESWNPFGIVVYPQGVSVRSPTKRKQRERLTDDACVEHMAG